jgi:hypothetical protein
MASIALTIISGVLAPALGLTLVHLMFTLIFTY